MSASRAPGPRLYPSLLDRLTNDTPSATVEPSGRFQSIASLRAAVMRDLEWLLNTGCLSDLLDLAEYPEVATSVLNYGVPSLVGHTARQIDALRFERAVREAIARFEPRVVPKSLKVRWADDMKRHRGYIFTLEIEGDIWAIPVPEHVLLRSRIDVESGKTEIEEAQARGGR